MLLLAGVCRADDWFCSTQASARSGNVIKACGTGYGASQDVARSNALQSAAYEFKSLCSSDTGCRMSSVTLEPKRTECKRVGFGYQCERLVVYTLSPETELSDDDLRERGLVRDGNRILDEPGMDGVLARANWASRQRALYQTQPIVKPVAPTLSQCQRILTDNSWEHINAYNECMDKYNEGD